MNDPLHNSEKKGGGSLSENHLCQNNWHDYLLNLFPFSAFPQTQLLRNILVCLAKERKSLYSITMMNVSISLSFTAAVHFSDL